ncbi:MULTISPECIES: class I SAM-dependent methyltransferase [Micromonospora]|uniref:Methyltransferase domain-containing protein n=1 Tax=Micromonospora yangpuensis TaxID=683228 RepID=A0A1C6UUF2_9ACTN|nr:class I SAM-dependent methyltransferase [Micromonospora yangpuensis]GGM24206.1 hypothetical protein GCM10012279_48220 [Micromonospora yangpuensis]SCL57621.1 Methyltransferase domain-containing protein [Micromonospora yangpuensis]
MARTETTIAAPIDPAQAGAFLQRFMGDISGSAVTTMCAVGDRLGLFGALAAAGRSSSEELAARLGLTERYVREWLLTLHSAGYLDSEVDPSTGATTYTLPPAHAAVLVDGSPLYMGGVARLLPTLGVLLGEVVEGFRSGSGIDVDRYPPEFFHTMWRMSELWLDAMLVDQWIPAVDGLAEQLRTGVDVAHLSSGSGRALILLAEAFPESRFVGFDRVPANVAHAREMAHRAGVADRVRFEVGDGVDALTTGRFPLVLALDVLHDALDITATLTAVAGTLGPDGVFLLLETDCAERPEENRGAAASLFYSTSTLYSVPIALAAGGEALGMMGLPPGRLRSLCADAGLSTMRTLMHPIPTFNTLYAIGA